MSFLLSTPMNIWKTSGDFCQTNWDSALQIIGDDPYYQYVILTNVYTVVLYWVLGAFFIFMDVTNKPTFLRKYKVQPGTNEPLSIDKLKKVIINVMINQIIVSYLTSLFLYNIAIRIKQFPSCKELPTLLTICLSLAFYLIIREFTFYYCHRLMHTKYFYKVVHKKHHEWTAPIAISAAYCHPIEHIFSNIIPIVIGPALLESHVVTGWIWVTYSIFETLSTHSGYHLPFMPSSEFHDYHHLKFNQNYGGLGLADWIHKTDEGFRNDIASKRHFMLRNLKSAKEIFPDIPKKSL